MANQGSPVWVESLTTRESAILLRMAEGKTNREIAEAETLAVGTVKWYVNQILSKLGALNRAEAVARALEMGLLPHLDQTGVSLALQKDNLPRQLTSFIGREEDITHLVGLVKGFALVTLTGSGGTGKSRLALKIGETILAQPPCLFPDGVWLVELAPLDDPSQVVNAVAQALGLGIGPVQPTPAGLIAFLYSRQILLILDNCEHLIDACSALVRELLQSCPTLKILATSREKLGLAGEIAYRVLSLAFPPKETPLSLAAALDYPALLLFVERASAVHPGFQVIEDNLLPVSTICRRLDGIPLALELAASHLDLLTVEQLADRLKGSFSVLTGGDRTALPRHQTLRATIDWSYQLLIPKERLLLDRLSVFAGDWTLEAAEAVCAGEDILADQVLRLMSGLVHKSMVTPVDQIHVGEEPRFILLETVRQYAQEKLCQSGTEHLLLSRHCAYVSHLAKRARPRLEDGLRLVWAKKLDADQENLIKAIGWSIDEEQGVSIGLGIINNTYRWWHHRGQFLQRVLGWLRKGIPVSDRSEAIADPVYIEALTLLAFCETDLERSTALVLQAVSLARQLGQDGRLVLAFALEMASGRIWLAHEESEEPLIYVDEALRIIEEIMPGDSHQKAECLDDKTYCLMSMGRLAEAGQTSKESRRIFVATGDIWYVNPLNIQGFLALEQGNFKLARAYFEEALRLGYGVEDSMLLRVLEGLARLEREQGHLSEALAWHREAIRRSSQQLFYFRINNSFQNLAYTEIICSRDLPSHKAEEHLLAAARLIATAKACESVETVKIIIRPYPVDEAMLTELRRRLAPAKFEAAWADGLAMTVDRAANYALTYSL